MKSAPFISPNLLERVAEPQSPFHADYLAYWKGEITRATADVSRAELLHPIDGWHASVARHNVLGDAAFGDLASSLEFLRIPSSQ
jgi:hypothetical protein